MRFQGFAAGLLALFMVSGASSAQAAVIGFDDLVGNAEFSGVYEGFVWVDNWHTVTDAFYSSGYSNTYGAVSPSNAAFNGFGVTEVEVLATAGDFDFTGAYFSTWAQVDSFVSFSSTTVTVEGWDDGGMVDSMTIALSSTGYTWLGAGFTSIDQLVIRNDGGSDRWWLMDDFTYDAVGVPEPSTLLLLGTGLAMVGIRRRRQTK